ncbi:MAG: YbhB/YbcL family Raf kinase inhibitor-like protein [bacterium]
MDHQSRWMALFIFFLVGGWNFMAALSIKSPIFEHGKIIPKKCACSKISPPLSWSEAPAETVSFALICDDPDAPREKPWVHWVIFNIPKTVTSLPEHAKTIPGATEGINDSGNIGYDGPCPPKGHGVHRYFFKLYALDTTLNLLEGATKDDVERAMKGHILEEAEIMGTFERKK